MMLKMIVLSAGPGWLIRPGVPGPRCRKLRGRPRSSRVHPVPGGLCIRHSTGSSTCSTRSASRFGHRSGSGNPSCGQRIPTPALSATKSFLFASCRARLQLLRWWLTPPYPRANLQGFIRFIESKSSSFGEFPCLLLPKHPNPEKLVSTVSIASAGARWWISTAGTCRWSIPPPARARAAAWWPSTSRSATASASSTSATWATSACTARRRWPRCSR